MKVLTATLANPATYGRVERDAHDRVVRIVEVKDDDPNLRLGPTEINSGMMVLDAEWAREALPLLEPSPATGEYYLTDLVELAVEEGAGLLTGWPVAAVEGEAEVALGINDRIDLAAADDAARDRVRRRLMLAGVTLVGPETIFVDEGVEVGPDSTILPFTCLRAGTVAGARCTLGPHAVVVDSRLGDDVVVQASTVEETTIAAGSDVGPYAHLRAGTEVGSGVHVGNYAELKNARLGAGVRVGHFSYLGDVTVGEETNIGAGTITANYDGVRKHPTAIGDRAFIGSDTILRAPVRVGDGARTGAGSVVTRDVPDGATAVGVPARVVRRQAAGAESPSGGGQEPASEGSAETSLPPAACRLPPTEEA